MDDSASASLFGDFEFTVAIPDHFLVELVAIDTVMRYSFLLNVSISLIEGDAYEIRSEI